jgi:uncharacterized membrane protein YjgN (DUF898 family)
MSNPQFNIVLKGVLPGFDPVKAQANFAAFFSLDDEKVASLFVSKNSVLKANVSQDIADKYQTRLAAIGVNVVAEPVEDKDDIEVASEVFDGGDSPAQTGPDDNLEQPLEKPPLAVTQEFPKVSLENNAPQQQQHKFIFTGNGTEYFKIWIVNLLLSIVTLGIYSAWAKVRNKQYFYGNTHIAGHTFEYTAEPIKILKGRVIAFLLYLGVAFAHHISPIASVIATLVFLVFLPLIIVSSLKFNARHSSYRHIPFRFTGTSWGALKAFILLPLAGVFTMGLLIPLAWKRQTQYITNNHHYGKEPFRFDVHVKEYFFMFMILMALIFGLILVFALLAVCVSAMFGLAGISLGTKSVFIIIPIMIGYLAFYLILGAYIKATMANIHWNNTKLERHSFTANWEVASYAILLITNTLGILLTLGLFIPFARVRTAIYKANHMTFVAEGNLDNFIANELEQSNSLAEGVHDIFDIDISI